MPSETCDREIDFRDPWDDSFGVLFACMLPAGHKGSHSCDLTAFKQRETSERGWPWSHTARGYSEHNAVTNFLITWWEE